MSVGSHESNKSVFVLVAERYQWVRDSMRRPWRIIPKREPGTQTEVPTADDRSFTSFRSEPVALADEGKVGQWDDGMPELKSVNSFALAHEMVIQAEMEPEKKGRFRFLNNIILQAIAVVCVVCLVIK